ncbi:hypothetical protein ABFS83_03G005600 [Erythranthe nasuta]
MKSSLRLVVFMFLVLLCRGENENKAKVCMQQIYLDAPGAVCSVELCTPLCQKALEGSRDVRGTCIGSDVCNCIFRC